MSVIQELHRELKTLPGEDLIGSSFNDGSERGNNSALNAEISISGGQWQSIEITGLGIIALFIVAFWALVSDGTLPLGNYLVFVLLLLSGAGGLLWRIWKRGRA